MQKTELGQWLRRGYVAVVIGLALLSAAHFIRELSAPPLGAGWSLAAQRSLAFNRALEWRGLEVTVLAALFCALLPAFLQWQGRRRLL